MTLKKNAFILSTICALASVNAYPNEKQAIKEYTTPPPPAEALSVSTIPPLFANHSNTAQTAPETATQNPSH